VPGVGLGEQLPCSDAFKRQVWEWGQLHSDRVTGLNDTPRTDDRHDAGFPDEFPVGPSIKNGSQQPAVKEFDLVARVPQPRHFENSRLPDPQEAASGQIQQVYAACADVLAQITGSDLEPLVGEFIEEFRMDQVNLSEVGLRWIGGHTRPMLDRHSEVRIPFDAEPGNDGDGRDQWLGKAMRRILRHGDDTAARWVTSCHHAGPYAKGSTFAMG